MARNLFLNAGIEERSPAEHFGMDLRSRQSVSPDPLEEAIDIALTPPFTVTEPGQDRHINLSKGGRLAVASVQLPMHTWPLCIGLCADRIGSHPRTRTPRQKLPSTTRSHQHLGFFDLGGIELVSYKRPRRGKHHSCNPCAPALGDIDNNLGGPQPWPTMIALPCHRSFTYPRHGLRSLGASDKYSHAEPASFEPPGPRSHAPKLWPRVSTDKNLSPARATTRPISTYSRSAKPRLTPWTHMMVFVGVAPADSIRHPVKVKPSSDCTCKICSRISVLVTAGFTKNISSTERMRAIKT